MDIVDQPINPQEQKPAMVLEGMEDLMDAIMAKKKSFSRGDAGKMASTILEDLLKSSASPEEAQKTFDQWKENQFKEILDEI